MNPIKLIRNSAKIPSFSTNEKRMRPYIQSIVSRIQGVQIAFIPDNNIIISGPGRSDVTPVALTAHLDKINHFGTFNEKALPFSRTITRIRGQLDDAVGIGICLYMLILSERYKFPPLLILFSELEEHGNYESIEKSTLFNGIGSCRISQYLMDSKKIPGMFITIDTSAHFKGGRGVALYSRFWEKCSLKPEENLIVKTEAIERYLIKCFPFITVTNGTNDYINYGMLFNSNHENPIPSIAIEPAIHPIHNKDECVYISDIKKTIMILKKYLMAYTYNKTGKKYL